MPPAEVSVALPLVREVGDFVDYTGRTQGNEFVELRARVSGYLTKVNFKPGASVKKGDLLFEIDPRPYQAALDQAIGEVKRGEAAIKTAIAEFQRFELLVKTRSASVSDLDKAAGLRGEAEGALMTAKAAVENAKLNLEFTRIVAPISGIASRNDIDVGNLISPNTLLTTVVSNDPMLAYYDIDERTVLRIQQQIREGRQVSARESGNVPVLLGLPNEGGFPHKGTIDFVDNRVDPNTGTIRVRGTFPNPVVQGVPRLTPGMFVRIRLPIGKPQKALLVNERAVATNQGQKFLMLVNEKNEVGMRPVTLGRLDGGLRVIEDGLKGEEKVIVVGLQRVRPGAVVNPKTIDMPTTAATVRQATSGSEKPASKTAH